VKEIKDLLFSLSDTAYMLILAGILLVVSFAAYTVRADTALIEKKIALKQKDLSRVLELRERYETKKRVVDRRATIKAETPPLSLTFVEEMTTKHFTGGRLTTLKPATGKAEGGKAQMSVELKVSGAPLNEVVSFLRAIGSSGFAVKKLNLTVPANQATLDMQAVIADEGSHG
jgi:hypothetical protein